MKIAETLEGLRLISSRVSYDPDSGALAWKAGTRRFGKPCGSDHHGYLRVSSTHEGITHYAMGHRLAWFIVNGEPAPDELDHWNLDKMDNRWSNLRVATRSINMRNVGMRSDNTSGITGVSFEKNLNRWRARAMIDGASNDLGLFDDKEQAGEAVRAFRLKNGFTENHGSPTRRDS